MTGSPLSPWAEILYGILGAALVLYALTGGADLGAGLWSLLATGERRQEQRRAVQRAIAPIWEANHVWLIFVIVVMFSAFPFAFSALSIALHIPLALALLGIVFRGAAFVFHAYGIRRGEERRLWERIFAWASLGTPVLLGMVLGGASSGAIRVQSGVVTTGFTVGWLTPFSILLGIFALTLSSLLAAVYLTADTEGDVREDFRKRALITELAAGPIAGLLFWRAALDAPALFQSLAQSSWTLPVQIGAALSAFATIGLLLSRRFTAARFTAAAQVTVVIAGWGLAMERHFILPDLDLYNAGSQAAILPWLVIGTGAGSLLLVPSLIYLYRVFKLSPASSQPSAD